MNAMEFRAELVKIMPGYTWTVHKTPTHCLTATGILSSGFNRLSTLEVTRKERDGVVTYGARSSGYGTKARWLHECVDGTLARALRRLQDHYECTAAAYRDHAASLRYGRAASKEGGAA